MKPEPFLCAKQHLKAVLQAKAHHPVQIKTKLHKNVQTCALASWFQLFLLGAWELLNPMQALYFYCIAHGKNSSTVLSAANARCAVALPRHPTPPSERIHGWPGRPRAVNSLILCISGMARDKIHKRGALLFCCGWLRTQLCPNGVQTRGMKLLTRGDDDSLVKWRGDTFLQWGHDQEVTTGESDILVLWLFGFTWSSTMFLHQPALM